MVRVELNGGHFFKRFMIRSSITTTAAQTARKHCGHVGFGVAREEKYNSGSVIGHVTEAVREEEKAGMCGAGRGCSTALPPSGVPRY